MIRLARFHEWSQIEAWRKFHFAEMAALSDLPRAVIGQKGFDDALWVVAERNNEMVAAASYLIDDATLWVYDLFAKPGCALAALALGEVLERIADDNGLTLRGNTDPENRHFVRVLQRRGYELTSIGFKREPRQRKPGSGATAPAEEAEGAVSF